MTRRRLILGTSAAALSAVALLLGGVLRDSPSASSAVASPPAAAGEPLADIPPADTGALVASLQATLRANPDDVTSLDSLALKPGDVLQMRAVAHDANDVTGP